MTEAFAHRDVATIPVRSARIERLRARALKGEPRFHGHRAANYVRAFRDTPCEPRIFRQATGLAGVITGCPNRIFEDELLVGHHYLDEGPAGRLEFPEWYDVSTQEAREHCRSLLGASQASSQDKAEIEWGLGHWHELFGAQHLAPALPREYLQEMRAGIYAGSGSCLNHSIRDYAKVMRVGFAGIRQEILGALERLRPEAPEDLESLSFLRSALLIAEAGRRMGVRFAEEARRQAEGCTDPQRKEELGRIAQVCEQVPAKPARSFWEALQALWFAHMITCWEDDINANSIGRIDQFLYPYYKADKEHGRLTDAEALELIEALWVKLYRDYDVQQAVLSGHTPAGEDATNALTYLFLEATQRMEFVRCLSVRVHKHSPQRLLDRSLDLVSKGGGIPFFFNDDVLIPSLRDRGIAIEDARDYAMIGCVEVTIPGRANPHAVSNLANLTKCFELALNNGSDLATNTQYGPQTGRAEDFGSMQEVFEAYKRQVEFFAGHAVFASNRGELEQQYAFPLPYRSLLTSDCIERGRDITRGGARYNYHSTCAMGIPNVADSLMAIKRLVFEERKVTLRELVEVCRRNFEGAEDLRQRILWRVPKYGNDDCEVDALAVEAAQHFCLHMLTHRTLQGGTFFTHLFSFLWNVSFGKQVWALPDGRKAGEPLAYSISPMQGRDRKGLTALLNSLTRMPHRLASASSSAIIGIDPTMLEGEGRAKVGDAIKSAIDRGLGQLQINVVNAETLRKAQACPEQYGNLTVRVSGFSSKFTILAKDLQDHIIARTKHRE